MLPKFCEKVAGTSPPAPSSLWMEEQWAKVLQDYELSESDEKPDPKFEAYLERIRNQPTPKPLPYVEIDDIPGHKCYKPIKRSAACTRVRRVTGSQSGVGGMAKASSAQATSSDDSDGWDEAVRVRLLPKDRNRLKQQKRNATGAPGEEKKPQVPNAIEQVKILVTIVSRDLAATIIFYCLTSKPMVTRRATRMLIEHALSSEDAERVERRREVSRCSSRKHYYKDIDGSRERGAARKRAVRARKRALFSGPALQSLEAQQEASRKSSKKHYYKNVAVSREKCAARARKYREAKKQRQINEASPAPLPSTPPPLHLHPLQLRGRRHDIRGPPILSPLPPSSPLAATPHYRSNFRQLAKSSSDEDSEDGGEMHRIDFLDSPLARISRESENRFWSSTTKKTNTF
ncbi:hypothetical protein DFP72DRAFT_860618 [Ephemerocybe angulata]|uniref:Uncharacterized protein n=1 Tax=Ephemerocybe angulata TaxID=980116 RepID=A0A8H6H8A4_9AGAR|nr:hypothetical protein DFP72DRAFT_860618 [Tulosesus angulatus]